MQGNARPRAVGRPVSAVRRRVGRAFQPDSAARRAAALAVGTDLREPPCPRVSRPARSTTQPTPGSAHWPAPGRPNVAPVPPCGITPRPPCLPYCVPQGGSGADGRRGSTSAATSTAAIPRPSKPYPPARTTGVDPRRGTGPRRRSAVPPPPPNPLPLHPRHQVQGATRSRRHGLEQVGGGGGVSFHGFQSLEDPPADDRVGVLHIAHVPHQLASALVCDCRSWAHARPDTARGAQPRAVVAPAGTWVSTALGLCVAALQTSVWT